MTTRGYYLLYLEANTRAIYVAIMPFFFICNTRDQETNKENAVFFIIKM